MMNIKTIGQSLLDVLFPRTCPVCEKTLLSHEKSLCTKCMLDIPTTGFHLQKFNPMEQLFAGKIQFEKATGYFFYEKDNPYANILHDIKYRNQPQTGRHLASIYGAELTSCNYFTDIDCIIPVPLHNKKLIKRGYNQSEYIAQGFADSLNVPVYTDIIIAVKNHDSQTNKGIYERWLNTQGIYMAKETETIENKHVLIVDDVVTTGATLLSAASSIADVPGIKISLATLGVARLL